MDAHGLLDALSGRPSVVERNTGNVVVQNVGLYNVVEKKPANEAKLSIDRGGGASSKCPFVVVVVRQRDIGVLQIRDEHKPMVGENVWQKPVDEAVEASKALAPLVHHKRLRQHADVGEHDVPVIALLKDRRLRVEVRHGKLVVVWVFLASDVGQQIPPPASKLLH
ncbi:hypothetical protein OGATHE_001886 [Ogataea polymorpha]|uniref:Uncharacterized protein n=1 Tax=Ogataea polymorpha TaxID=460523 RepID=A0A9P8TCB4_9ASCO|nr:hypothetical protein OGATHE_001886 [Ogataea polymorpha]